MPTITLLYAGILGIISLVLAMGAASARGPAGVSIGTGDDPKLLVANRRHGNFIEWVPMALLLMALLEANGVGATATHVFGIVLTIARICHPLGLDTEKMTHPLRFVGAAGTFLLTAVMSVWAIVLFFTMP